MKVALQALAILLMLPIIAVGFVTYVVWDCLSLGWHGGIDTMARFATSVRVERDRIRNEDA